MKDVLFTMEATNQPISSMCFKAGQHASVVQTTPEFCPKNMWGVPMSHIKMSSLLVGNEDLVYASAGNKILSFDVRMVSSASLFLLCA